jgi:hypothetical protein
LDFDLGISDHGCADARDAQATLFVFFLAVAAAENWVDEDLFKFSGVGVALFIGYEESVRQVDLVGRQADAFVFVHQIDHFVDHFSQFGVDSLERLRAVPERRMGILNDLKTQSSSDGQNDREMGRQRRLHVEHKIIEGVVPVAKRDCMGWANAGSR